MKELSIEEKAKAYDEALEKAKNYHSPETVCNVRIAMENLFPELKENEDERIRKELIVYLSTVDDKELIPYESWIAWLEKQGNKDEEILVLKDQIESLHAAIKALKETHKIKLEKQGEHAKFCDSIKVGDKVTRNEDGVLVNLSQLKRVAKPAEVQGEQKSADKIKPKFHEGDWITIKE